MEPGEDRLGEAPQQQARAHHLREMVCKEQQGVIAEMTLTVIG
jgi:hypothetical protein